MIKKISVTIIIILLFGSGLFFYSKSDDANKIKNYPSSGVNIVAFGDSLTHGLGATEGKSYVDDLQGMINQPIINMGKNGDTTTEALQRTQSVIDSNPKVVLILLGGNDFLQQIPKETTFNNLTTIITRIQDAGAVVVLLGIQGGIIGDKYRESFDMLANEYHTAYVPNVLDGIIGHSDLMSDPIHPNDKGYARIADKVYPVLQSVIK